MRRRDAQIQEEALRLVSQSEEITQRIETYPEILWDILDAVTEHDDLLDQLETAEQRHMDYLQSVSMSDAGTLVGPASSHRGLFVWECLPCEGAPEQNTACGVLTVLLLGLWLWVCEQGPRRMIRRTKRSSLWTKSSPLKKSSPRPCAKCSRPSTPTTSAPVSPNHRPRSRSSARRVRGRVASRHPPRRPRDAITRCPRPRQRRTRRRAAVERRPAPPAGGGEVAVAGVL